MADCPPCRSIYLAASYSRRAEIEVYAGQLRGMGHRVTSRWHQGRNTPLTGSDDMQRFAHQYAMGDIADIEAAGLYIAFTTTPMPSEVPGAPACTASYKAGGTHVEFGIALAFDRELWVVGPRENIFHFMDRVRLFDSWTLAWGELKT